VGLPWVRRRKKPATEWDLRKDSSINRKGMKGTLEKRGKRWTDRKVRDRRRCLKGGGTRPVWVEGAKKSIEFRMRGNFLETSTARNQSLKKVVRPWLREGKTKTAGGGVKSDFF